MNACALASSVSRSFFTAGFSVRSSAITAATCIAVGNVSFDDCPLLTSSFSCTSRFAPALAAEELGGAVREHFVHVHVGLRAGAGLPHDEGKMLVELARERFVRGSDDRAPLLLVEDAEGHVHGRRGFLHEHLRAHDFGRHRLAGEMEVMQAALGLRAPQPVLADFDVAHRVVFDACLLGHEEV